MSANTRMDEATEHDSPMTGTYVRVLIVEAVIVVALWIFGTMFS